MQHLSRSIAMKIAALISLVLGVGGFILALPYISLGANVVNQVENGPPFVVIFGSFLFAIIRILTAYGTWRNQRWSIVVTILANVGDVLFSVPGILFAPTASMQIGSLFGTVLGIAVIVLCLWRDSVPVRPS